MPAIGTSLICPHCKRFYADLYELAEAGGRIYSLGLATKAQCGACGKSWAIWPSEKNFSSSDSNSSKSSISSKES